MIKEAAIKKDGIIYTGKRHSDIFKSIQDRGLSKDTLRGGIQGFVTRDGKFVDRKIAGKIAYIFGQIEEPTDCLMSEDLY